MKSLFIHDPALVPEADVTSTSDPVSDNARAKSSNSQTSNSCAYSADNSLNATSALANTSAILLE